MTVSQVGAEGRVGGAAAGYLDGVVEASHLVERGQAAAAFLERARYPRDR